MRKMIALILTVACMLSLIGCNSKSMDSIIANKPSVTGTVEEVHSGYVTIFAENVEGYPNGSHWSIPLDVENSDSVTDFQPGDVIVVYYEGPVMESYPLQIQKVYAITLEEPADRGQNEKP